ncbi:MAG: hypothetical protein KGJ78_16635 [Alphaproteobacteria bacterium]|nr:hypothetical protein [Alphaproteobacteria bacterium]
MTNNRERALPEGYAITDARWRDLTKDQQQTVLQILKNGGAVSVSSAKKALPNATALVLLRHHGAIVGIGTIKPERVGYAKDKQAPEKAGYAFDPKMLELGYVVVHNDHRNKKLSGDIVTALLTRYDGPLFATTDAPNMKHTLRNRDFVQRGQEWKGKRGTLSLWLLDGKT